MGGRAPSRDEEAPVRVMISYAHDNPAHTAKVRQFWALLRRLGIDARLDLPAGDEPQDWPLWMLREIKLASYVLIVASPEYRRRAEGEAAPDEGRGVQYEAAMIREQFYANREEARQRFLPVVLPGGSSDNIPAWIGGTGHTHYAVAGLTQSGVEKLLRYITGQPYETIPPLGKVPRLSSRSGRDIPTDSGADQQTLLPRLPSRASKDGNEAILQASIRQLLLYGGIGIDEEDLGASLGGSREDERRIEISRTASVIEVRASVADVDTCRSAEEGLARYLTARAKDSGRSYVAILTDAIEWRLYRLTMRGDLELVDQITTDHKSNKVRLLSWLDAVLSARRGIVPTPPQIAAHLGANSPGYLLDFAELRELYAGNCDNPSVRIKRQLWAKLLTTALGTNFQDEDELFINHTLLVLTAEIIGHAVVGIAPDDPTIDINALMSGQIFSASEIRGVVEPDFFDWLSEAAGGEKFVRHLARRLTSFSWDNVEHDVLKVIYESIIGSETRHRLGEYYTPDWLAEEVLQSSVSTPLDQTILDASCGSGTFLFHAIRRFLTTAEDAGMSPSQTIDCLVTRIVGIDVHPVAVTLARVTYLLAIGISRIQAEERPAFAVPVYLGDSLHWGKESDLLRYHGLTVSTAEDYEIFSGAAHGERELRFPEGLVEDAGKFDRLVGTLADLATQRPRESEVPSIRSLLKQYGISKDDEIVLTETFRRLCRLHDENRDHIWAYYVRNLARPLWLSRPKNRVDVLVGNPPWLAYKYMTDSQQVSFRAMSVDRGLWKGSSVAPHQDLSALFVARCVEQYLRPGGRFAYVMPCAVLTRNQYRGFRTGSFSSPLEQVKVRFDRPWDLHRLKPSFFPVPASVVFGVRVDSDKSSHPLTETPEVWSGRFDTERATWARAEGAVSRLLGEPATDREATSPYGPAFAQGASVVPRVLFVVEPDETPRLGTGPKRRAVRSRRSPNEKTPWKTVSTLHGLVEKDFVRPLLVGYSLMPYKILLTTEAVIPWEHDRLIGRHDEQTQAYRGLAGWMAAAEDAWDRHRSEANKLDLLGQIDFRGKLTGQFPIADLRVVYAKSGMYMAAAILRNPSAIVDHELYWAPVSTEEEALYLTAVLNSQVVTEAVRPLQARGEHNPRHFDKYVWQLPIPRYDAEESSHRWLVALAERAQATVTDVVLLPGRFEAARRQIREALVQDGVAADIDSIVKQFFL